MKKIFIIASLLFCIFSSGKNIKNTSVYEYIWLDCSVCASLNKHVYNWYINENLQFDFYYIPVVWNYETEYEAYFIYSFLEIFKDDIKSKKDSLDFLFDLKILKNESIDFISVKPFLEQKNIDENDFKKILLSDKILKKVNESKSLVEKNNIQFAPTFYINSKQITRNLHETNDMFFQRISKEIFILNK